MSKKVTCLSVVIIAAVLLCCVSSSWGSRASDRRALMKQTLKLQKQNVTGVVKEEEVISKKSEPDKKEESVKPAIDSKSVTEEKEAAPAVPKRNSYPKTTKTIKTPDVVKVPVKTKVVEVPQLQIPVGEDELLNLVPEEALFCLRINNIDESLMQIDQYLLGVAPIQVTPLIKMQLGNMLEDPMLSQVNTEGNLVIFGVKPWYKTEDSGSNDPVIGMIVPIKSKEFFVKYHNSNVGSQNYGFVTFQNQTGHAEGTLKDKIAKSSLLSRLDGAEYQRATTAPVWAFGNISQVAKDFRSEINDALVPPNQKNNDQEQEQQRPMTAEERKELRRKQLEEKKARLQQKRDRANNDEVAQDVPDINEQNMKMLEGYFDFIKTLIKDADYGSVTIAAASDRLDIKTRFAASDNSKLAKWLDTDSQGDGLQFTNALDGTGTMNVITKINKESSKEMSLFFSEAMTSMYDSKTARNYKSYVQKTMDAAGDDGAFSFSLTDGKPPFELTYIVEVNDAKMYRESAKQMSLLMNDADGAGADLPMIVSYSEDISRHNGASIDRMLISFNYPDNTPEGQAVNSMYDDGMDYRIAYKDNVDITVMGPYADENIIKTLDNINATEPAGDIKTVLEYLPEAESSTFMGSFNALRLLEGVSGAVKSLPMPAPQALLVSALFDDLGQGEPQSCLGFAGNMDDGHLDVHIVLPKEHLGEIIPVINQIKQRQQHMMEQQMPGHQ